MIIERAVGDLFTVDPGLVNPGAALFRAGKLVAADRIRTDKDWTKLGKDERAKRVASAIIRWGLAHDMEPRVLVYEWPQWYDPRKRKTKGDPNDLAGVLAVGCHVSGQLSMALQARDICLQTVSPTPAEWTGGLPKVTTGDPWESPRGQRVAGRLDADEKLACAAYHDAVDAVGLGLYYLGRFNPLRVYHGAS